MMRPRPAPASQRTAWHQPDVPRGPVSRTRSKLSGVMSASGVTGMSGLGVRDQAVDPAEGLEGRVREASAASRSATSETQVRKSAPAARSFLGDALEAMWLATGDHEARAGAGQQAHDAEPMPRVPPVTMML